MCRTLLRVESHAVCRDQLWQEACTGQQYRRLLDYGTRARAILALPSSNGGGGCCPFEMSKGLGEQGGINLQLFLSMAVHLTATAVVRETRLAVLPQRH